MQITFPDGARVDARLGPVTIQTDQPAAGGGEGSAPTPFALFLASLGTCAGIYVLGFLRQRGLSTDGVRLIQRAVRNPSTGMTERVEIEIKYQGYIKRQRETADRTADMEHQAVPAGLDYSAVYGLSGEARQKLAAIRPLSIGQATRISGITPSDIGVLLVHLKRTGTKAP